MAKKSKIVKEQKREALVAKYAELRRELKAKGDYEALRKITKRFFTNTFNTQM